MMINVTLHQLLPDRRVIVSVPCSIHSRKPPLGSQFCLILFVKGCTVEECVLNVSYNTVWSGIREYNEHMPLQTVLYLFISRPTY